MKQCTICKKIKDNSEFYKNTARDNNALPRCIHCENKRAKKFKRSKSGVISQLYSAQKASSKKRGHRLPEYSREELKEWLYSQALFHELYNEWVQSGYTKRLKPSVDRVRDETHYCFSNIRLCVWYENNGKPNTGHFIEGQNAWITIDEEKVRIKINTYRRQKNDNRSPR